MLREIECATAEDFIDEMSVSRGRLWESTRTSKYLAHDWILRGMTRASWPLRPSAMRPNAFIPIWPGQASYTVKDAADQRNREDHYVMEFASEADQMGHTLPSDRPELRDRRRAIEDYQWSEFPPIEKLHMYALAQHYGVPTRLLDWTTKPRVAAYFAVERVARIRAAMIEGPDGKKGTEYLEPCAVWAVNGGFVRDVGETTCSPRVHIVTSPRATNPNLAAQGGLFTLVQPVDDDEHPLPDLDEVIRRNAALVPREWASEAPLIWKFTLPATQARVALRMLATEGVHAGTIYPGLAGVVAAMQERKAHQWATPGSRS